MAELFAKGILLFNEGKYRQSIIEFTKCIKKTELYKEQVYSNIGVCYEQLKDYRKAFDSYLTINNSKAILNLLYSLSINNIGELNFIIDKYQNNINILNPLALILKNRLFENKNTIIYYLFKNVCMYLQQLIGINIYIAYIYYLSDENDDANEMLEYLIKSQQSNENNHELQLLKIQNTCKIYNLDYPSMIDKYNNTYNSHKTSRLETADLKACHYLSNYECDERGKVFSKLYNCLYISKYNKKIIDDITIRKYSVHIDSGEIDHKQTLIVSYDNVYVYKHIIYDDTNVYCGSRVFYKSLCEIPQIQPQPQIITIDTPVCVLYHSTYQNYYHWMIEILAKFFTIESYLSSKFTVLIPKQIPQFIMRSIDLFLHKYKSNIIYTEDTVIYKCLKIYDIDYINDINNEEFNSGFDVYSPSKYAIVHLCKNINQYLNLNVLRDSISSISPIYIIYVQREHGIRSINNKYKHNEELIISKLRDKYNTNFKIFTSGTLDEQIELFSRAKIIFGPHGAGLSNMIFLQQNTYVLEFMMKPNCNKCFQTLAKNLSINHAYIDHINSFYYGKYTLSEKSANDFIDYVNDIYI